MGLPRVSDRGAQDRGLSPPRGGGSAGWPVRPGAMMLAP